MDLDIASLDPRALALGLLEAAPDAVLVVRPGGIIALANRMAEKMFGYDRSELIGASVDMLVPADARDRHAAHREGYEASPRLRGMSDDMHLVGIRKNGAEVPVDIALSTVDTPAGRLVLAIVRDVSRRRELERALEHASTHDALTDLHNRAYLDARRRELDARGDSVGVLLVDIDGLKAANDRNGHKAGDQLLRRCAVVLRGAAPEGATVARLGGDEFAIMLPGADAAAVDAAIARLRVELDHHNEMARGPALSFSVGGAVTERRGGTAQALRLADRRMYDDKRSRGVGRPR